MSGGNATDIHFKTLESLLRQSIPLHQSLLDCMNRKREAVRTAAISDVPAICAEELAIMQRIESAEHQRRQCVAALAGELGLNGSAVTITDLARAAPDSCSNRLIALATQLRDASDELRRQSTIVRSAMEALHRHITGVVHTVGAALSQTRLYGAGGQVHVGQQVDSCVDVTS